MFGNGITPRTARVSESQRKKEEISKLKNEINELQIEFKGMLNNGRIKIEYDNAVKYNHLFDDQIDNSKRIIESYQQQNEEIFTEAIDELSQNLESAIKTAQKEMHTLTRKIHVASMQNITNQVMSKVYTVPNTSELFQEDGIKIYLQIMSKINQINITYRDQILTSKEMVFYENRQRQEKDLFEEYAGKIDSYIESIGHGIENFRNEIELTHNAINELDKKEKSVVKPFKMIMANIQIAENELKQQIQQYQHKSAFLNGVIDLLAILQDPAASNERIKFALESALSGARIDEVNQNPSKPVNQFLSPQKSSATPQPTSLVPRQTAHTPAQEFKKYLVEKSAALNAIDF